MKINIVIPIRYTGTRMEGRPLLTETGWPLIRHVYEQAKQVKGIDNIIIATDDERVKQAVSNFGGECVISDKPFRNGSERVADVAKQFDPDDIIINIQGDEPEIDPVDIENLIEVHRSTKTDITTAAVPFDANGPRDGHLSPLDPNCVKVITSGLHAKNAAGMRFGQALYFSRSLIPYPFIDKGGVKDPSEYLLHSGIYLYSVRNLQRFVNFEPSELEQKEKLEQLRAIENEMRIVVGIQSKLPMKINTLEDYKSFAQRYNSKN